MVYLRLTPAQKKHFQKLKAAYKACQNAGIYFVNMYGTLEGYDSSIVEGYSNYDTYNKGDEGVLSTDDFYCSDTLDIVNEWTDDEHLIKLTPKGKKKLLNGEL